jgi:hypothetical protein
LPQLRRHKFPHWQQSVKTLPHWAAIVASRSKGPHQAQQNAKEPIMKKERRWLKSVLAAAAEPQVVLPWQRGARRKPEAMKTAAAPQKPRAIAAR